MRSLQPSLLLQFLLGQFLKSYETSQTVEAFYNSSSLAKEEPSAPRGARREALLEGVTELSGQVISFAPTFPWTIQQGSLKALVHYSHLLQKKTQPAPLVERTERAYRQAVMCRQHLLSWKQEGHISPIHLKALAREMQSLTRNMHKVGHFLTKELQQYAHDENVIFFLLRHRKEFDTLFHAPYVVAMLEKMYRGGLDQAEQHLVRQYTKRGFENLLPHVNQVFANVRNETEE